MPLVKIDFGLIEQALYNLYTIQFCISAKYEHKGKDIFMTAIFHIAGNGQGDKV